MWVAGTRSSSSWACAIARPPTPARCLIVGSVDGRIATGLERPDVFDWSEHVRREVGSCDQGGRARLGGNDDHGYMTGVPEGVSLDGSVTGVDAGNTARSAGLMDTVSREGAFLVWIGLLITDADRPSR